MILGKAARAVDKADGRSYCRDQKRKSKVLISESYDVCNLQQVQSLTDPLQTTLTNLPAYYMLRSTQPPTLSRTGDEQ